MKWLMIGDEYYNVNSINKIVPIESSFVEIAFTTGEQIVVPKSTLQKIFVFTKSEFLSIGSKEIKTDASTTIK